MNELTQGQHERDARIQIVLDSYLQTYIDKKPVEEILKAKKKLFEAVDKEVSEAESRAVEGYKKLTFCNGIGRVHSFILLRDIEKDAQYQVQKCELCGFCRKAYGDKVEEYKELSQLQDKLKQDKGE